MLGRSPSRNQRYKGFKVKHALQICLLVAVCIWLLYQLKHSHDKKKAFEEKNVKISEKEESGHEILNFGRKDLHPRVDEAASENWKQGKEDETEEEDNKPEGEEEEEESKAEENEDEGRGGGDDEIDEQDLEKADEEAEHGEDFIDEEERESQEKESQSDDAGSSDDQDRDGDDANTQEAREQHYKGDDASSAVVRDTQTLNTENEDGGGSWNPNEEEHAENELERENITNRVKKEVTIGETMEGNSSVNITTTIEIGKNIASSELEDDSLRNSNITTVSNDQPEVQNNSMAENAAIHAEVHNNSGSSTKDQNAENSNITIDSENADISNSELEAISESSVKSNATGTTNETVDTVGQSEFVDASGLSIPQEIKDARIDLSTLPESETEGKNTEDFAA